MNYNFKSFVSKNPIVIVSILLIVMTLSFVVCSYTASDDVYAEQIVGSNYISIDLPLAHFLAVGSSLNSGTSYQDNISAYYYSGYYTLRLNLDTYKVNITSPSFFVTGDTSTHRIYRGTNFTVNGLCNINQTTENYSVDWYYTTSNKLVTNNNTSSRVFISGNNPFRNGATFFKLEIMPCYNIFNDSAFIGVCYNIYDSNGKILRFIVSKAFAYKNAVNSLYTNIVNSINDGTWDNGIINTVYYFQSNLNDNEFYREGYEDGQLALQNNYNVGGVGYNNIYNVGYDSGYSAGNTAGYNSGYNQGVASANQYTFSALISAVFDVPVRTITGLLDWDILGVNLKTLLLSLFSVAVVIFIVKIALGRS